MANSSDNTGKDTATHYPLKNITASVDFEYLTSINYSLAHNHCRTVVKCVVNNDGDTTVRDITVAVSGPMVIDSAARIDVVEPGQSVDVTDSVSIAVDAHALMQLTEGMDTTVTLTVKVGEAVALEQRLVLSLMPFDQWMGTAVRPELVASFVTPNHPMLSKVNIEATRLLKDWTGAGSLDDYQSRDPNRVRMQVAAIYEALRRQGIVYATLPASFEKYGQRIRLVDKVLNEKLANCIEASLLVASCLEAAGLNSLIVLTPDHCMVGAWLVEDSYKHPCCDDVDFLLKSCADGINEIVVFEGVDITSSSAIAFDEAVAQAQHRLHNNEFLLFVDVKSARINGVRPLPMRVQQDGQWVIVNDGDDRDGATTSVKQYDRYDLTNYDAGDSRVTKYTIWERKLLDFSLRNNLLNMRLGRSIIPLVSYAIDTIEDAMQAHEAFRVLPFPLEETATIPADRGQYNSMLYPQLEKPVTEGIAKHQLYSFLNETSLANALKNVYRASRTSLEENGANNLYMVFGILQWYDTERSKQPLYAPILLLPIEIVRRGGIVGYEIRMRDEEMILNITLVELLKQQHDINLTLGELPRDHSGVDVKLILSIVRDKIKNKKNWNVMDESVIGLFSFNKFVMWNDIHSNSELMRQNPIVSSLVEGKLNIPPATTIDIKATDSTVAPHDLTVPIDVDSSQLEAIIASGLGDSFILHGPPGTGKSQTITNMIANALYQGKRVLFVAEKMAALSVVQSRLERIGLAPFCLELHSNKVTKQHFLRQMQMALDVVRRNPPEYYAQESAELFDKRRQLIAHIEALHRRGDSGFSLYDCITAYLSLPGDEMPLDLDKLPAIDRRTLEQSLADIADIDGVLRIIGNPKASRLSGLTINDGSYEAERAISACIDEISRLISDMPHKWLVELAYNPAELATLTSAVNAAMTIDACSRDVANRFRGTITMSQLPGIVQEWQTARSKWLLPRWMESRSLLKRLHITEADMAFIVSTHATVSDSGNVMSQRAQVIDSLTADGTPIDSVAHELDNCRGLRQALDELQRYATVEVTPDQLAEAAKRWLAGKDEFRNWYLWCRTITPLRQSALGFVADYIVNEGKSGRQAADALAKAFYHQMARRMINADESLRYFDGVMIEQTIEKYRALTRRFQQLSIEALYCRLAANMPEMTMAAHESSELGILKRNIKNGGRGTSIRKIIDMIPNLLPRLCPCMLMSPLSVAQYIDLKNEKFDIVIFDEASQMPTSEAVGAIARGKSLIVVGDPRQMPPTSFFATSAVNEDEAYIDDMESILDDCISLSVPSRYLSWHYRSKHESLIAFSNSQYYESRLTTFPSVDDQVSKVSLRYVGGVYDRSRSRSNVVEAQAVVDEVIRRLSDPVLSRMSIGIVSFSKVQQDKIEDMLTDALARDKSLEALAYDSPEPIFIKNLENVQGDERDVILFSVGYGPDKTGKVSMNFGPLNNAGGERRLNVAVSRSRYEMVVFSSLHPEQIDLRRTNALGVEGLKRFLEFAQNGRNVTGLQSAVSVEDNIAIQIAAALEKLGYQTRVNVGRSQFRVDVAVIDNDDPSRFRLGILCDGPNYYATQTVRDREVVQPAVLRTLGWNIMRVWTLDWYERRPQVIDSIVQKLREEPPSDFASPANAQDKVDEAQGQADAPAPERSQTINVASSIAEETGEGTQTAAPAAEMGVPYVVADLPYIGALTLDDLEAKPSVINNAIKALVEFEAPITDTLVCKRLVKHLGMSRVTPRLQGIVNQQVKRMRIYTTTNAGTGCVLWQCARQTSEYEAFRTDSDRDILDIPIVEVANAMLYIIRQQISLDREALMRLTANALGFSRLGSNITNVTDLALSCLVDSRLVTVTDNRVTSKE